jgi:ESF2/ABP1 family protein
MNKKDAKNCALILNSRPIFINKKKMKAGSINDSELWCIKYLPDFKWANLTERISYENAVKEQRIREQLAQGRRENKLFLRQVEKARVLGKIEEKRSKKQKQNDNSNSNNNKNNNNNNNNNNNLSSNLDDIKIRFRQRKPIKKD